MAVMVETGRPEFSDCVHLKKSMAARAHEHRHRMILAQSGAGIKTGRGPGSRYLSPRLLNRSGGTMDEGAAKPEIRSTNDESLSKAEVLIGR